MKVLRAFDFYQPGQTMTADDIDEQRRRGNLPDLIRNGFVEPVADTAPTRHLDAMSYRELQALAQEHGIRANQSADRLRKELANVRDG